VEVDGKGNKMPKIKGDIDVASKAKAPKGDVKGDTKGDVDIDDKEKYIKSKEFTCGTLLEKLWI